MVIDRLALLGLTDLANRHASQLVTLTASGDPSDYITDQMLSEYLDYAIGVWNDLADLSWGLGIDTVPLDTFEEVVRQALISSQGQYRDFLNGISSKGLSFVDDWAAKFDLPTLTDKLGIQPGSIRSILTSLAGGPSSPSTPQAVGVSGGPIYRDFLSANGVGINQWIWIYGETARREFNGHKQMDGLVWDGSPDDPRLEVAPQDRWIKRTHYAAGVDHYGCGCICVPYLPNFDAPYVLTVQQ